MSTDTSTSYAYCEQAHHRQCRVIADVKLRKGMLMKAFPMSEKGSPQQDMPLICEMLVANGDTTAASVKMYIHLLMLTLQDLLSLLHRILKLTLLSSKP